MVEAPALEAHSVLSPHDRHSLAWRLIVSYTAFGREDLALGIVNDVLAETDRRRANDRTLALDCLSALLLQLAPNRAMRAELPPYIAQFASLALRATRQNPDQALGRLAAHLLDRRFDLDIDQDSRSRLREVVDNSPAVPQHGIPSRLGEILASLPIAEVAGFTETAARMEASWAEADDAEPASEQLVLNRELELQRLEHQLPKAVQEPRTASELAEHLANYNAWQLQDLLRIGAVEPATRRAYRLFQRPRNVHSLHDVVRGAALFLLLARLRWGEEVTGSPKFYNSVPVRRIRDHFASMILPGALDNQFLPLLARNLDFVRPLSAELLLLYSLRSQTHESAFALIVSLNELIFDRMAWKIQELARTERRVDEETDVLLSEYEKLVFDKVPAPGVPDRGSVKSRRIPYSRLSIRVSDHAGHPHRFAPRLVVNELRRSLSEIESLVAFHMDRNGLWLGLVRPRQRPVVLKLCDPAPAESVISAYRDDARTGAIRMWTATDFGWFGDIILAQLHALLPAEVHRLVVMGSQVDIPLHAAYVRGYGYAIEHYCVTYEQSRSSLAASRTRQQEPLTRLALVAYEGRGDRQLPLIAAETASIASEFRDRLARQRVLASCRSVKAAIRMGDLDGVHFSGHMRDPVETVGWRLQLRDGELDCLRTLRPIARHLRLVVLMACSAGANVSQTRSLEAGLPHALVALGSGAVIAPRRPIADPVAASFSAEFYSGLAASHDIPEAFRQSVARLAGQHGPGAWSSLVLHGR